MESRYSLSSHLEKRHESLFSSGSKRPTMRGSITIKKLRKVECAKVRCSDVRRSGARSSSAWRSSALSLDVRRSSAQSSGH